MSGLSQARATELEATLPTDQLGELFLLGYAEHMRDYAEAQQRSAGIEVEAVATREAAVQAYLDYQKENGLEPDQYHADPSFLDLAKSAVALDRLAADVGDTYLRFDSQDEVSRLLIRRVVTVTLLPDRHAYIERFQGVGAVDKTSVSGTLKRMYLGPTRSSLEIGRGSFNWNQWVVKNVIDRNDFSANVSIEFTDSSATN